MNERRQDKMKTQDDYTVIPQWVFDEMPVMGPATLVTVICLLRHKRPMAVREIATYTTLSKAAVYKGVEYHAIEKVSALKPEDAKRIVSDKYTDEYGVERSILFNAHCEWCKVSTAFTHAHHYPIPKSEGGTETVNICPNCHTEYHALMDTASFQIKEGLV